MNLIQTVEWLKKETNRIEAEKAPQAQINAYNNILAWLCELMRYRLFLSEFTREIELTEQKSKEDLLKFIADEASDWKLCNVDGYSLHKERQ